MTPKDLLLAIREVADQLDLVGSITYGRPGSPIATIEASAHELAHYIFTGAAFEQRLNTAAPRTANRHEASALRIEVAVLSRLGCDISLRTLGARSKFLCDDRNNRPPWISMTLPLTTREERCAFTMIRWLREALDELHQRRST